MHSSSVAGHARSVRHARLWRSMVGTRSRSRVNAMLDGLQPQDLLLARTTAGNEELVEVVENDGSSAVVKWKGQVLKLQRGAQEEYLDVENIGHYPEASGVVCQKLPQFQQHLQACQESAGPVAWRVAGLEVVSSLDKLTQSVSEDPTIWCDGTRPGAPEHSPLTAATLAAGMLLALIGGQRGIATLQLWNGWDKARGQPVYNPLALHVLEKALSLPGVSCLPSIAPGGVGLTAIVYVDKEPWSSWAKHLASFGMQANIVAGSPFYKLLIGRLLGYKEENVRGYVAATSAPGALSSALINDVDSEMRKLSKVKPKLPWNCAGSRGKKKADTARTPAGFGKAR